MLKFFLAGQIAIGNGNVTVIRAIAAHQAGVVIGVWLFLALGLAIALPAAIRDGFFDEPPPARVAAPSMAR